ncbi:PAS domain S-box protein [Pedobacter sp. SYSU D00535]|uniref:PAS domain-containing sensor histidine kinase n=1 Tax=Pedobacter sp. SYSU D00535 TaxID=2810308 RepID=UPI001A97C321|nr:PAS domain S-box protein [Pedobacter sp. SYSU D00535]
MKSKVLGVLRAKAEKLLNDRYDINDPNRAVEFDRIFHELQVHQVELEMQNDELMAANLEIQKQKDRFSHLFESAPVGYIVVSREGLVTDINQTALRLFNNDKSMMRGKPLAAFVSPGDISCYYQFLNSITKRGTEQSCELQLLRRETGSFWGLFHAVPVGADEPDRQIYVTLTDITEKQAAEKELRQAKQRLDLALEASATGICELNLDTRCFYLDEYSCRLFGLEGQFFAGPLDRLMHRIHPDDRRQLENSLRVAVVRQRSLAAEFRIINEDEDIKHIQARGRLVDGEEQRSFLATFTDVTERKLWEQETQRLKDEQDKALLNAALEAEENEKKRMSDALHDGVAQMLYAAKLNLDHLRSQAKGLSFQQVADLIEQTIKDVRDLSFELTPAVLLDYGLRPTVEEMTRRLASEYLSFSTDINLGKSIPASLQLNIYRITQELVNNAIKHARCDKISIEVYRRGDTIFIEVSDNGVGVKKNTGKSKPNGTGLSSIRNRIKLYDGKIAIKANVPSGTQVSVKLKYIEPASTQDESN